MPIYAVITRYVEAKDAREALTMVLGALAVREAKPPYPWCVGYPLGDKAACAQTGYCKRNPNCGE